MDFMDFVKKVLTIYFYTALYICAFFLAVSILNFFEDNFLPREIIEAKYKTGCAGLYFEQEKIKRELNATMEGKKNEK